MVVSHRRSLVPVLPQQSWRDRVHPLWSCDCREDSPISAAEPFRSLARPLTDLAHALEDIEAGFMHRKEHAISLVSGLIHECLYLLPSGVGICSFPSSYPILLECGLGDGESRGGRCVDEGEGGG